MKRVIVSLLLISSTAFSEVNLFTDSSSSFSIYRASGSPSSVIKACADLQNYIEESTGEVIPLVTSPTPPMICVGANASQAAIAATTTAPLEGYRIITDSGNIYIFGQDLTSTPQGGTSNGSANGVYSFLEDYIGVRWLMPSDIGDYVPFAENITIPDLNITAAPSFLNRRLPNIQNDRTDVQEWEDRHKLGHSLYLQHGHSWDYTIPTSEWAAHPEWFCEGITEAPTGDRYKLCITDAGLRQEFADVIIAHFDSNPNETCYSLSPSDSAGWCECADCLAEYETDPFGELSVTPAVINFYNAVAVLVAEEYPDKCLGGYVYASYIYPPQTPIPVEDNVYLVLAASWDYGYQLYEPKRRNTWTTVMEEWSAVTDNLAYYDLPNVIRTPDATGALSPAAPKILNFIYPQLKANDSVGLYVYGVEAWGRCGPANYIMAKLAWNPDADVYALSDEWCDLAYGPAAEPMKKIWAVMDAEFERHYNLFIADYDLSDDMMEYIYAEQWDVIETLFLEAEAIAADQDEDDRLEMTRENLTVLHWHLRTDGLLTDPTSSSFYLDDAAYAAYKAARIDSLALQPED